MEEKETVREPYRMVLEGGQAELVEKKSRFIANVRPVESEAEAVAFIDEMKKKYWDARHNCSAFVIGTKAELTRCSDDGEPSGTAGRPMLEVLLGEGVRNVAVVVTRYFGGVLLGLLTAHVYDRTCKKAHKGILGGVFSGERWSFTCMAALAAVLGFGACFVWPPVQKAIGAFTGFLAASGNIGLFLYGFLERLLIPTGLHHLVYMPFQFSQLGGQLTVGSVTYTGAYVVMMTEYNLGLPFSDGIVWMYTGFTKTFGYFGIAAAFIFCARRGSRRKTAAQLLPLAFTASLASVTEPMDFLFCFSAPVLWLAHAAISGVFIVLLHLCHVTAFTSNLLGSLAMNLSAGVARTHYPVLYLLGLAQIAVYFVVFTALIKALDLPTPGRRPEEPVRPEAAPLDDAGVEKLIAALGGRENICTVDNCFTRLRVTVQDAAFVREQALRELPCSGVVQNGCNVQIVYGIRAPQVRQAVEQRLDRVVC